MGDEFAALDRDIGLGNDNVDARRGAARDTRSAEPPLFGSSPSIVGPEQLSLLGPTAVRCSSAVN
jgi:hypothetical protein